MGRWWIGGLGLAGGAGVLPTVEPPEVSIAGVALEQPSLFEQRLRLDLRLRNPNDFAREVERVRFDLEVNDDHLGKGWTTQGFEVPAYGEAVVPVTIVVPTTDLIQRMVDLGTAQRLEYRLKGDAKLTGVPTSLSFERDGELALPQVPE
jgi:LEA14-like dessication related protein